MDFDKKDGLNYLDSIPFKISSSFIPPPAVILPPLPNTNEEIFFQKFQYDFSKEKKALEDIQEMREKMKAPKVDPDKSNVQNIFSVQSDILTPKPQKVQDDKVSNADDDNNSKINLSDFENDTSSPFDYMELQTINDLEELSNVFQGLNNKYSSDDNVYKDKNSVSSGLNQNNFSKSSSFPLQNESFESLKETEIPNQDVWSATKENCFYPVPSASVLPKVPCLSPPSVKNNNVDKSSLRNCKSYSDIHNLSEHSSGDQERPTTPPLTAFTETETKSTAAFGNVNCDNCLDPYLELPKSNQKFVDAITDMGFPRPQVSRTVKHLGMDEKMVVEHLCQIQTLEETGYDSWEAEAALHLHDYNQEQAKKFLDLIKKLQDLGFERNVAKIALIKNRNDWNKTIDTLLS